MGFSEREKLRNADLPEFLHEVTDAICDKLQEVTDERDAAIGGEGRCLREDHGARGNAAGECGVARHPPCRRRRLRARGEAAMTDAKAIRILHALDEDESRPRYCSDAGAATLHRMNVEAIRFALQAIEDRAALCDTVPLEYVDQPLALAAVSAARRHMRGEE